MTLHAKLTEEIRRGPSGPNVGAFFDLDQTLLAGFSAFSFFRERLMSGRVSPREIVESTLGALSFGLGNIGFSGFMSATTAAFRGLAESALEEIGEEVFDEALRLRDFLKFEFFFPKRERFLAELESAVRRIDAVDAFAAARRSGIDQ